MPNKADQFKHAFREEGREVLVDLESAGGPEAAEEARLRALGARHEEVRSVWRPSSGLRAIVAIHSTVLGPSLGGTRFRPYATVGEAVTDVLRLSKAMTYKARGRRPGHGRWQGRHHRGSRSYPERCARLRLRPLHRHLRWAIPDGRGRRHHAGRHGPHR